MQGREIQLPGYMDNGLFVLTSPWARYPLRCRPNSSDPFVFVQVFIDREFACLDDVIEAGLIIDCGANVGYSAAYFLSRFPGCDLIAVEPDESNYRLLVQNLAPYGPSVRTIHSAVWSQAARLKIWEGTYRDGREWTRQVQPCGPDEPGGFEAVDIGTLLRESGRQRISILKIDIEGAEAVVFADNFEPWIGLVDNLVIELHDDSMFGNATSVFAHATEGQGFSMSKHGELTVCRRPKSAP
jgi:FkbM family methyltransferase